MKLVVIVSPSGTTGLVAVFFSPATALRSWPVCTFITLDVTVESLTAFSIVSAVLLAKADVAQTVSNKKIFFMNPPFIFISIIL
uniref:Uncharacterized protein n=1 Tax=Proteus vulgaris TaxID=585 RepID=Q8KK37_PROVU|nr:hypothetical protein [Proteus vulgaris]